MYRQKKGCFLVMKRVRSVGLKAKKDWESQKMNQTGHRFGVAATCEAGFTMVEVLTAIMVLVIGLFAVLTVFTTALQASLRTKVRTASVSLANEQLEMIRNLSYEQVYLTDDSNLLATGEITASGPDYIYDDEGVDRQVVVGAAGVKANVNDATTQRNGIQYRVRTYVVWVDDPVDQLDPDDTDPQDYKRTIVKVSWSSPKPAAEVVVASNFLKTATTVYPTIRITDPYPDEYITGTHTVMSTADVNDATATITKVVFYLYEPDGSLAQQSPDVTVAPYNWNLDTQTACGGPCPDAFNYNIKATVFTDTGRDDSDVARVAIDNTAPDKNKIIQVNTIATTSSSLTLSWKVQADVDGVFPPFKYRIYRKPVAGAYQPVAEINSDGATDGVYTNTGLSPDTKYFFRMQVVDHVGKESLSVQEVESTTAVAGDIDPPNFPVGATITAQPTAWSTIYLEWTASTDADAIGYEVQRYFPAYSDWLSIISPIPVTELSDTDLEPGTTYKYRVYVIDAAGNLSTTYLEVETTTVSR